MDAKFDTQMPGKGTARRTANIISTKFLIFTMQALNLSFNAAVVHLTVL